ncbi:hypothetical protein GGI26_001183 [Coemansia sp. RSA 1358]|uniref:Uncharacterized protein n=1 Tax=Coemansia umbellata TaxID=1424467 RepID=A0ABQ8PUC1_9FUNG|nr:hypothetical protein EDC05_000957 [Coemansia umbellata]KAJ2624767.1 hypothetical protein GGI26_001183 [Coemansia sp. RSA 1358]
MGQPRLRLVNKDTDNASDDSQQPVTPRGKGNATPSSRSKRTRKSDAYAGAHAADNGQDSPARVKEECLRLYQAVKELEKDGEPLCIAFNKLPPKKEYPDYYVEIEQPVALDIIKGRITRGLYSSVSDFVADIDLMCSNAQTYNMPESYIYEAAGDIRRAVHKLVSASIPADEATTTTPSVGLKLRIRQSASNQSNQSTEASGLRGGDGALPEKNVSVSTSKRKRAQDSSDSESDDDEESEKEGGDADKDAKDEVDVQSPSAAKSKNKHGDALLDELFQSIYDADLTKALRLLKMKDIPINDYRKVVMKDTGGEDIDNDEYTWAPLHAASCYGRLKVAQILCDKGADIEAVDTMHQSTPLAWAAYTNRKRLAKYLVRMRHANVNARNAHNQLPIEIAMDPGNPIWAEFLLPTDGTKVDLPKPIESEEKSAFGQEPKKTPSRKVKSQAVDNPVLARTVVIPGMYSSSAQQPLSSVLQSQMAASGLSRMQTQSPLSAAPAGGLPIPQCIGGIGHQEVIHPKMTDAMREIVDELTKFKDSDGNRLAEPFEELPDSDEYPEYFEVIVYPMALDMVKSRINTGYRSFEAFNYDILWIFNNATFFNEAESDIYLAAIALEKEYKRICCDKVKKYDIPFDTSYIDAEPSEGRYVSRITTGDNDLFVGDFIYIKTNTGGRRIAMISRLRIGGPGDRRKYIDGYWLLTPAEVPELAGQPVYPHQLFVGSAFESQGVRGISGKCYVLLPNVYARVYPQGFSPLDLYVCESRYISNPVEGQPGTLKALTNWAHEFKTPLMRPPSFIPYIVPFVPTKQPAVMWNNTNILPHPGLTVLNRDAAARAQSQAQGQAQPHAHSQVHALNQTPNQPHMRPMSQAPVSMQSLISSAPLSQANIASAAAIRPPGGNQQPLGNMQTMASQGNMAQAHQMLAMHHQQNLAKAQAQLSQRESNIRKQVMDQIVLAQQQNPNFIGSVHHQALMKQQTQLVEQSQQAYFAQLQQLQQTYNHQVQSLNQTIQQQQQQQQSQPGVAQSMMHAQQMSPMQSAMNQMNISSPHSGIRPMHATVAAPMSPLGQMQMSLPAAASLPISLPLLQGTTSAAAAAAAASMMGLPQNGIVRPGIAMSPSFTPQAPGINSPQMFDQNTKIQQGMPSVDGGFNAAARPATPSMATSGGVMNQIGMSSPLPPGINAQAMMTMLLQQQQQQQQQQQPSTPKSAHTPLSPNVSSSAGQLGFGQDASPMASPTQATSQVLSQPQNQQAIELWRKSTSIFISYGNQRIVKKSLGIQLATSDASMFMHLTLSDKETNHALQMPQSAKTVLLRPVPGPFSSSGKVLLSLLANGRRCLPRVIPDSLAQTNDNALSEETPSHASDEADKEDASTVTLLAKSAGYAYEISLQAGMNIVDIEVLAAEWRPESLLGDAGDQQVPPATPTQAATQKQATQRYSIFLTR